ncbi:Histidine kinase [Sulfidibacter corallicola]|uniref:histidine kinase n=1 Tax=Sulfidibacter corallicola TaxID=2818388 RepID=A0A8A4TVU9_SULCO|nr:ATP-binding protein [Sulfidibacter corallicola]QTD50655.1 HAMP domain-containing protein [Sulfidibacter corallicola]
MASLRLRIFLALGAVVIVSLATTGLVSYLNVRYQVAKAVFLQVDEGQAPQLPLSVLDHLVTALEGGASPETVAETLSGLLRETDYHGVVFDGEKQVHGTYPAELADAGPTLTPDGSLHFRNPESEDAPTTIKIRGPFRVFRNEAGAALGYLYLFPNRGLTDGSLPDSMLPEHPARRMMKKVNTWQSISIVAIGLLALFVLYRLSRRLLRPIEHLTLAVREIAAGDLSQRVDIEGDDEVAELAAAFNAMAGELARQENLRKQMVCDVAHELRTPVTNIRCELEAIRDGLMTADAATIESILEEVLSQSRLVEELQDLSLAEAGTLALHPETLDFDKVIDGACKGFASLIGQAELSLVRQRGEAAKVRADPERLRQILGNLLRNAIAHTPAGGTITVTTSRDEAGAVVTIADSGKGIPTEHLAHIFERFYRVDSSRSSETGGTGLGLTIVKNLTELMGGQISVTSEAGKGTSFRITFPESSGS